MNSASQVVRQTSARSSTRSRPIRRKWTKPRIHSTWIIPTTSTASFQSMKICSVTTSTVRPRKTTAGQVGTDRALAISYLVTKPRQTRKSWKNRGAACRCSAPTYSATTFLGVHQMSSRSIRATTRVCTRQVRTQRDESKKRSKRKSD